MQWLSSKLKANGNSPNVVIRLTIAHTSVLKNTYKLRLNSSRDNKNSLAPLTSRHQLKLKDELPRNLCTLVVISCQFV